jgi:hypothetical protein
MRILNYIAATSVLANVALLLTTKGWFDGFSWNTGAEHLDCRKVAAGVRPAALLSSRKSLRASKLYQFSIAVDNFHVENKS